MLRRLFRHISYNTGSSKSNNDLKELFFRSNTLPNHELVDVCKRLSDLNILDIRAGIGKQDFLKTFIMNVTHKLPQMETNDIVTIFKDLIKNPDLRDYRHTFTLWPNICKILAQRVDSFTVENIVDTLHSLCFLRVSTNMFEELIMNLKRRLQYFDSKDYLGLPLNKFSSLLWAMNFKKLDSEYVYQQIYSGFTNHKDIEFISYEQISMITNFFIQSKAGATNNELVQPLINILREAFEENKIKSVHEMADMIYFMTQNPQLPDSAHEQINKTLILRCSEISSVMTLTRIMNSHLKFSEELKVLLCQKMVQFLPSLTIIESINTYLSGVIESSPQLKNELMFQIKLKMRDLERMQYSKIERMVNAINLASIKAAKELFVVLEDQMAEILEHPNCTDSLMIRTLKWTLRSGMPSNIHKVFLSNIMQKQRLPYYHTRDLMTLVVLVCNYPLLQTNKMLHFLDHKLFEFSHLCEYLELSTSLYFLTRKNRIGIETQELMAKRLIDKDFGGVEVENYSLSLVSAVLNNNLDYCRRNLPIIRVLMSFKGLDSSYTRMSDVMKRIVNDFTISVLTLIRCLWTLAYLDIKDARVVNERVFAKLLTFEPNTEMLEKLLGFEEKTVDRFHVCILMQVLAILGKDIPECRVQLEKLANAVEPWVDSSAGLSKQVEDEIGEIAAGLGFKVKKDLVFYGNRVNVCIEGKPVFVYGSDHFRYQTEGYFSEKGVEMLTGYYLMTKKMMNALGIKIIEIEKGEWKNLGRDAKTITIQNLSRE